MFKKNKKNEEKINRLDQKLLNDNIKDIMILIGNKRDIFIRNFLAGISRGIGIAIGFTILGAMVILFFQKIVVLNLPVIGEYISDIAEIVEKNTKNIKP